MSDDRAARGKAIRDSAFGKAGLTAWAELNEIAPVQRQGHPRILLRHHLGPPSPRSEDA